MGPHPRPGRSWCAATTIRSRSPARGPAAGRWSGRSRFACRTDRWRSVRAAGRAAHRRRRGRRRRRRLVRLAGPPAGPAGGAAPPGPPRPAPMADFQLAWYDHLLRLDAAGRWWFECLWTPGRAGALAAREAELRARAGAPRPFATSPWTSVPSAAGHELAVAARARADPRRRPVPGQRVHAAGVAAGGRPARPVRHGRGGAGPGPGSVRRRPDGRAVASLSPELFLERRGRRVRTAPIKGTRPRSDDPAELERSAKDRAENTMIVDLMRNDLGRVCTAGSVTVDALAQAREHAGVWHLVSEVSGELREDAGDGDLVRACFPPGSVTGAPKIAAQNVIAELGVDRARGLHGRDRVRLTVRRPGAERGHPHVRVRRRARMAGRGRRRGGRLGPGRRGARVRGKGGASAGGDRGVARVCLTWRGKPAAIGAARPRADAAPRSRGRRVHAR